MHLKISDRTSMWNKFSEILRCTRWHSCVGQQLGVVVEWVISHPRLQQVKRALIMMHQDYPRFFEELESNSRLQVWFGAWFGVFKCFFWNLVTSQQTPVLEVLNGFSRGFQMKGFTSFKHFEVFQVYLKHLLDVGLVRYLRFFNKKQHEMVVWVVSWCKCGEWIFFTDISMAVIGFFCWGFPYGFPLPAHPKTWTPWQTCLCRWITKKCATFWRKRLKALEIWIKPESLAQKNRAGLAVGKSCPMDLLDVLQIPTERWRGHSILADVMKTSWNRPDGIDRMFVSTPKFNRSVRYWF